MSGEDIPSDSTGDVLRRLIADGVDLWMPLTIDFHIAAPSHRIADLVAARARMLGFVIHLEQSEDRPDWTVWCSKSLVPSHCTITATESVLDALASEEGAWLDGWGTSSD